MPPMQSGWQVGRHFIGSALLFLMLPDQSLRELLSGMGGQAPDASDNITSRMLREALAPHLAAPPSP
eukprot:scaffold262494_cov17-Prasinocladus_malaysianus.AAC.1